MHEDPSAESAVTPERIGLAAFALAVPAFAYLGYTAFDDVLFGGLVDVVLVSVPLGRALPSLSAVEEPQG